MLRPRMRRRRMSAGRPCSPAYIKHSWVLLKMRSVLTVHCGCGRNHENTSTLLLAQVESQPGCCSPLLV